MDNFLSEVLAQPRTPSEIHVHLYIADNKLWCYCLSLFVQNTNISCILNHFGVGFSFFSNVPNLKIICITDP